MKRDTKIRIITVVLYMIAFCQFWVFGTSFYQSMICPELTQTQLIKLIPYTVKLQFNQCNFYSTSKHFYSMVYKEKTTKIISSCSDCDFASNSIRTPEAIFCVHPSIVNHYGESEIQLQSNNLLNDDDIPRKCPLKKGPTIITTKYKLKS